MILNITKNGTEYHGMDESDAISQGIHKEYLAEKINHQYAEIIESRRNDYVVESDQIYMEWQFDKTAEKEQQWRDKVAEIKARYPLPPKA
ncbi:hypothetical protein GTG28_18000 [Vibrio sp. OCN044]|uniref:Phage protein n=1 Tax=Vibrio tetraodonis subsp. pristinus TaxID=2695891 RepID=A0A6L8LZE0_9VIBR|nr:hypothetical protein [Vibrio tetraodonis]MYM61125.1 hypothetical protein [Vibrio tetraodonis subsp. pristinus]